MLASLDNTGTLLKQIEASAIGSTGVLINDFP